MKCSLLALAVLSTGVLVAIPGSAARIGLDDRNGVEGDSLLASGSNFDELRLLITDLGHTIVPLSSFEAADLAAADIAALYLSQTYTQSGGGYSASEISAVHAFVGDGGGLVLHGDAGFDFEAASMDSLAGAFGVSFASTGTEPTGHTITLFESHPVTAGVSSLCVDFQRVLSISDPAVDLTTLGAPLVPADDALAAVTGVGGAGNVVIVSDTTAFADAGADCNIDLNSNRVLAQNILEFALIPEPSTALLLALGLVGFGALRTRRTS